MRDLNLFQILNQFSYNVENGKSNKGKIKAWEYVLKGKCIVLAIVYAGKSTILRCLNHFNSEFLWRS